MSLRTESFMNLYRRNLCRFSFPRFATDTPPFQPNRRIALKTFPLLKVLKITRFESLAAKYSSILICVLTDKGYPGRSIVETGRLRHWAYPGIRHTGDLEAPRQWSLPSSLIVSTTSGILKDYPLLYYHREERSENHLLPSLWPRNNWKWHETPAHTKSTRECPWKIVPRGRLLGPVLASLRFHGSRTSSRAALSLVVRA